MSNDVYSYERQLAFRVNIPPLTLRWEQSKPLAGRTGLVLDRTKLASWEIGSHWIALGLALSRDDQ
jgi:hypothetical protein